MARNKVADELNLADKDQFKFCWIVDFPMYEWNEDLKKIDFSHNPFSMPGMEPDEFLKLDPANKDAILAIRRFNTTWCATASSCPPARSAITAPR